MVSILLVDDHQLFRQSLRYLLVSKQDFKVVAEAVDGQEAVIKARTFLPDVILMDVAMPKLNGISAIPMIRQVSPASRILMLSMYRDDRRIRRAIEAGADGYILKDTTIEEFEKIIRATLEGKKFPSPFFITRQEAGRDQVALSDNADCSKGVYKARHVYSLSDRESDVLTLLIQGLDNSEIAGKLFISRDTVKMHITSLLRKMGVKNRTEAAVLTIRSIV